MGIRTSTETISMVRVAVAFLVSWIPNPALLTKTVNSYLNQSNWVGTPERLRWRDKPKK